MIGFDILSLISNFSKNILIYLQIIQNWEILGLPKMC